MRLIAVALATLVVAAPAAAAVKVAKPDVAGYPRVAVNVVTSPAVARAPRVTENGAPVSSVRARNLAEAKSVVLAVDRSQSMKNGALEDAVAAARTFVRRKAPGDRIAVVAFGSRAVRLSELSGATIDADIALRDLSLDTKEGTALNDAVALAARTFAGESPGARVVVVLTDGRDVSSVLSERQALAAAKRHGVAVYAIGIESKQFSPHTLRRMADETGGSYRGASSSGDLTRVYAELGAELRRTWRIDYVTAARPGDRVQVRVDARHAGAATVTAVVPGSSEASASPQGAELPGALDGFAGVVAIGFAVWAAALLALKLMFSSGKHARIRRRLAPHVEARADRRKGARRSFAAMGGMLNVTEKTFAKSRHWERIERFLERGDVPLRTVEFVYLSGGAAFVLSLVAAVTARSSLFILAALVFGAAAPSLWVSFRARSRLKRFEAQLPDLLLTLAASLKAGHSFKQGMQTVVDEGLPPASDEFKRVLAEMRLGRPMDDALADMAGRVGSKNFTFVMTAVTIQNQVGGSLAGLIDMVAEAVRQRQQFASKIRGLTSMGRASAYTLLALPFVIAAAITVLNKEYMDPLYYTSAGHTIIVIGLVIMTIGALILKKMVSFKG